MGEGTKIQWCDHTLNLVRGCSKRRVPLIWRDVHHTPFPPHMVRFLDKQVLRETVERIEGMDDKVIEEIVNRIPGTFLPDDQRSTILTGLIGRKTLVRQALRQHLPHS